MDKQFGCTWNVKQAQTFPAIRYDAFLIQNQEDDTCEEHPDDPDNCAGDTDMENVQDE
jgi:hypothetical protein